MGHDEGQTVVGSLRWAVCPGKTWGWCRETKSLGTWISWRQQCVADDFRVLRPRQLG